MITLSIHTDCRECYFQSSQQQRDLPYIYCGIRHIQQLYQRNEDSNSVFMALLSLSQSVQIKTETRKHFPNVYSKNQAQAFVEPIMIYGGNIKAQEVMIDYSQVVQPSATKVEFMIFFDIGDADTPDTRINFVRVYKSIVGRRESTFWSHYSESFILETDGTNKVFLSVEKEYPSLNAYLVLYVTGYYF